jgi:hypothetical protein
LIAWQWLRAAVPASAEVVSRERQYLAAYAAVGLGGKRIVVIDETRDERKDR